MSFIKVLISVKMASASDAEVQWNSYLLRMSDIQAWKLAECRLFKKILLRKQA